jgi:hypothetical protein
MDMPAKHKDDNAPPQDGTAPNRRSKSSRETRPPAVRIPQSRFVLLEIDPSFSQHNSIAQPRRALTPLFKLALFAPVAMLAPNLIIPMRYKLIFPLFFSLLAMPSLAQAQQIPDALPVLTVPASDSVLHIAIPIPAEARLEPSRTWTLVEENGRDNPITVDLAPAIAADGTALEGQMMLLARIPPGGPQPKQRRLRVAENSGSASVASGFRLADLDDKSLGLWEGDRPILVYNHGMLLNAGVPADRKRSTYIHPLYGLDGEVLTDDFPKDHYHHRGLFWAWPHVIIDGRNYSLWDIRGIEQRFERWLCRSAGEGAAVLGVENGWYIGNKKVVQERVWFRIYRASSEGQVIDMDLVLVPIGQPVRLAGAEAKSYGGLTLRFAPRKQTVITTPLGDGPDDLAMTRLAWADLSAQFSQAPGPSGAAIFISPNHPDFPPTWLTRHYGVLCVGWPGVNSAMFQPGENIRASYRVWIHRGKADAQSLRSAYQAYESLGAVRW